MLPGLQRLRLVPCPTGMEAMDSDDDLWEVDSDDDLWERNVRQRVEALRKTMPDLAPDLVRAVLTEIDTGDANAKNVCRTVSAWCATNRNHELHEQQSSGGDQADAAAHRRQEDPRRGGLAWARLAVRCLPVCGGKLRGPCRYLSSGHRATTALCGEPACIARRHDGGPLADQLTADWRRVGE